MLIPAFQFKDIRNIRPQTPANKTQAEHMRAPYASAPEDSRGRLYPEEESAFRSCYQRDRDRIIHASAFRR
ncbi:MAG: hypothetical protein AAF762_10175, partial [Pseudomonadota bacterium]